MATKDSENKSAGLPSEDRRVYSKRVAGGLRTLRSVPQEARRLGISKGWLYTEIREGRFPHVKLGSRVLLDPEDVDRFLDQRRVTVDEALHNAEEDDTL